MSFFPYPTATDATEAAKVIISKLKGDSVALPSLLNAGYVIEGYALSVTVPMGSPPTAHDITPCSESELQSHLELFVAGGTGVRAIPWTKIWAALKVFLDLWLSQPQA